MDSNIENMNWFKEKERLILSLGLKNPEPPQIGLAALLMASIELSLCSVNGEEAEAVAGMCFELLCPESEKSLFYKIQEEHRERDHLTWLEGYSEDEEVSAAFPPALLFFGLIRGLWPTGKDEAAWHYTDECSGLLDLNDKMWSYFYEWFKGTISVQSSLYIKTLQEQWSELGELTSLLVNSLKPFAKKGPSVDIFDLRQRLRILLDNFIIGLNRIQVHPGRAERLIDYLSSDCFRMAVLGEFKRGKSTFVNALIGFPGLMPVDILPCTSALTELKYGESLAFSVREGGYLGEFVPATMEQFRESAGAAAAGRTSSDKADSVAGQVPVWRVTVPSAFLEHSCISLVDSPGIGEDHARNRIAQREAEKADAAILIFDFEQQATLQEKELVEDMQEKSENLFIVVNRTDRSQGADQSRVMDYIHRELSKVTEGIPRNRIFPASALKAEAAIRDGNPSPWLDSMETFRGAVKEHLIDQVGPLKRVSIQRKVEDFTQASRETIDEKLHTWNRLVKQVYDLEEAGRSSVELYDNARMSVEKGVILLEDPYVEVSGFLEAFSEDLPKILEKMESRQEEWTSDKNLLLKPKQHVREISEKAQKTLVECLVDWVETKGIEFLEQAIEKKLDRAVDELQEFKSYLAEAGKTADIDRLKRDILSRSFGDAYGETYVDISLGLKANQAIAGVLSAALGYVVADLVLYYLLGALSFVHPVLLAVALAGPVVAYLVGGKATEKSWAKKKVFAKIKESLENEQSAPRREVNMAFRKAVSDIFIKLSESFRASAQDALIETRFQQDKVEKQLRELMDREGKSADSIRIETEEYNTMEDRLNTLLDEMEVLVSTL